LVEVDKRHGQALQKLRKIVEEIVQQNLGKAEIEIKLRKICENLKKVENTPSKNGTLDDFTHIFAR